MALSNYEKYSFKNIDPQEALEHIFDEYWDHEQKIYSYHRTMKTVKDYFYLEVTGLKYKDLCEELKRKQQQP